MGQCGPVPLRQVHRGAGLPLGRDDNSSMHGAHLASPEPKRSAVVTCILNDAAGSGHLEPVRRRRREAAEAHLIRIAGEHGVRAKILRAHGGTELVSFAAQAVSDESNPVVAGGGDGTVNAVATSSSAPAPRSACSRSAR